MISLRSQQGIAKFDICAPYGGSGHSCHSGDLRQVVELVGFLRSQRVEIHFLQPNDIGSRILNHGRNTLRVALAVRADALVNVVGNCSKQIFLPRDP